MTEKEQKYWFDLGREMEKAERTYFTSKEFWYGIILGMLTIKVLLLFF